MDARPWLSILIIVTSGGLALAQTDMQLPRANPEANRAHHPQYLSRVGKRKPPGAALNKGVGTPPSLERQERDINDHVLKSICKDAPGCEGGHLRRRRK